MRESWPAEQLGRHVELISGQHIEASLCNEKGYGKPYLTGPADFPDGEIFVSKFTQSPKVVCEPGDLLITVKGSGTGKTTIARRSYCISRQLMAVRPTSMDGGYLRHVLSAQTARMRADALGFIPGIGRSDVLSMLVGVPRLPEQQQIAEILDTLDDAIRKTEEIIAKLKQVKQGLLHDLLTRGIDENGELRDPVRHPEQFKDSPLGRIPKAWKAYSCEQICSEITVGVVVRPTQYYQDIGVPVLRSANVREEGIDLTDLKFMSEDDHRTMAKTAVSPGDVVTVRTGYPGTTAVVPPHLEAANCVDILISRPGASVDPHFLAFWVNSDFGKGQVLQKQGGLAQQHFNVGEMKELLVPVPNLDEQQAIAKQVNGAVARRALEADELAKLRLLKKGLMEDLLTGKVRVTPLLDEAT